MKFLGVIPARYASTRFPGKPLVDILGKSMIQRVYEQAKLSTYLTDIVVATDDERILEHVEEFGGKAVLTNSDHPSGTDRCYEAAAKTGENWDVIINIQGDEPFMEPKNIDLLAETFLNTENQISTLICPIKNVEEIQSRDLVKVVKDCNQNALYFSRFPIPFLRNQTIENWLEENTFFQHLGIYAYRFDILKELVKLSPSKLEKAESLEQLRWLEAGYKIKALTTEKSLPGIDTPEDLIKAENYLKTKNK
jgi:3-deoxy-manno-octulosonate cytidylyltransferase (CMP-KDO synthetase)